MTFLQWTAEERQLTSRQRQLRHRIVLGLLKAFGQAFPSITYELIWESSSINAQAWRIGAARYVRVYGGLARHPSMTKSGLALMLAHETGHHLGGPPSDPAMPWLSWQGQADFWAASVGMPKVWGPRARSMTLKGAQQILALHQAFEDEPDVSPVYRQLIFEAGANGEGPPACAKEAYSALLV